MTLVVLCSCTVSVLGVGVRWVLGLWFGYFWFHGFVIWFEFGFVVIFVFGFGVIQILGVCWVCVVCGF